VHAAADRLEFAPPHPPGLVRGLALAMLAHAVLVAALTWGVKWNRDTPVVASVEAELWSALPQPAAPPPVEAPPPAPPEPERTRPEPPPPREADIALEKEKKARELKEKERRLQEEQREREKQRKEAEKAAERKKTEQKKAAEERKRQEQEARKREAEKDARELEKQRKANLERMTRGLTGSAGGSNDTGSQARASGPSASYAGRIVARVRPNIVFTDAISGNAEADVEVRAAPDGTILSRRLVKSSGVKAWDEAVLKAIDKTETLPRDVDGRVPPSLVIVFRPKD
jgi:colicin import membrane protein